MSTWVCKEFLEFRAGLEGVIFHLTPFMAWRLTV